MVDSMLNLFLIGSPIVIFILLFIMIMCGMIITLFRILLKML